MKTDYSELVGKTLTWRYTNGNEVLAIVAGCDYSIGITIHQVEDSKNLLCCYNGAFSPIWKKSPIKYSGKEYKKLFYTRIKEIKAGLVDGEKVKQHRRSISPEFISSAPTIKDCAFSQ